MPVTKSTSVKKKTSNKKVSPAKKLSSPTSVKSGKKASSLKGDMIGTVQDLASKQLAKSYDQNGDGKFDKQDVFSLALKYLKNKFFSKK